MVYFSQHTVYTKSFSALNICFKANSQKHTVKPAQKRFASSQQIDQSVTLFLPVKQCSFSLSAGTITFCNCLKKPLISVLPRSLHICQKGFICTKGNISASWSRDQMPVLQNFPLPLHTVSMHGSSSLSCKKEQLQLNEFSYTHPAKHSCSAQGSEIPLK